MKFYPFHLGDYMSDTQHLSHMEDLCYRRMIDRYYLAEAPLPCDINMIARVIGMRDHIDIVSQILSEFFIKTDAGYTHYRCEEEIAKYKQKAERARGLADKRWHGQREDTISHTISDTKSSATNTKTKIDTKPVSKQKVADAPVVIPSVLDTIEFKTAWQEYITHRSLNGMKSLKRPSIQRTFDAMATWGHDAAIASINTSIRNGWQGIFEPRSQVNAVPAQPANKPNKYADMW
jgi:uncharacterized protein YdaU (DUF1376 family)